MIRRVTATETIAWSSIFVVAVAVCLVYGLRYSLGHGLWFDEALTTYFVSLDWADLFHFIARFEANMALYYVVAKLWTGVSGSELWFRLLSLICFAVAIWILALPLRRHFGARVAIAFAVLCLSHFYLARYSVEIRGYALAMLFMALLWFCWTRAVLDGESRYWLLYALTGIFAVHTHFFIALGIFCLGLMALPTVQSRKDLFRWLGVHGLIGLSFLPIVAFVLFKESGQLAWLPTPDVRSLIYLLFDYSGAAPHAVDLVRFGLLLTIGLLALLGLVAVIKANDQSGYFRSAQVQLQLAALILCTVPVGIVFLVSQVEPIFSTRFFTPFMPFYLMLGAIGLVRIFRSWSPAPVLIVMGLMAASAHAYSDRESNRWAEAFTYLASNCSAGDAVLYMNPRGQSAFQFYERQSPTECGLEALPFKLQPQNYFDGPEDYPLLLNNLKQHETVWIVLTHLLEPENQSLEHYREQIEESIGPCMAGYNNTAVEILHCAPENREEA